MLAPRESKTTVKCMFVCFLRGPNDQTKVTATLRPVLGRVLRLQAGGRWSTRARNTTERHAESLRPDRGVFTNPRNKVGFPAIWHPGDPKL